MAKPMMIYMPRLQFFDNVGVPVSGGQVFIYQPGTTTKLNTYTDNTLTTINPNPILLDTAGRPANNGAPIDMYVTQAFKMVLAPSTDTDPPLSPTWTEDNVTTLGQLNTSVTKSVNYTVQLADRDTLFLVDASNGAVIITLPAVASAGLGFRVAVKKIDSSTNSVTIQANAAENIEGSNTLVTTNQYDWVGLDGDGTQWWRETTVIDLNHMAKLAANSLIGNTTSSSALPTAVLTSTFIQNVVIQSFLTTGTYTPTANMTKCICEVWGAGGGGGGAANSSGQACGAGGGAGSYSLKVLTAAQVGASLSVTVGAGGAGGTTGNNPGSNGADSAVGAAVVGKGGTGGAGAPANTACTGGVGGIAGTGDITTVGNNGFPGAGGSIQTLFVASGTGGSTSLGGTGTLINGQNNGTAAAANSGSGGNGGISVNSGGTAAGGAGGSGRVTITEIIAK